MMSTAGVAGKEVAHRGSEEPEDRGNGPQTLCRHLSLPSSSRSARTLGTRTPLRLDERTSSATPGIPPLPATPTLLRTSSDSLLFKSSPGSEAALGGILDTIAEQGSTAWMALPDDILQTCELQLGSDALAEDHAEAAGASQPSKPRQRRPKPPLILTGNPLFRPTAADMGWSSNDFQAAELPSDEEEYAGLQTTALPETWLDSAIQQSGRSCMDVPLELTDDSIPHEASFWSQMNDKHDYPRDAALQIQHRRSRSLDQAPVAGSLFPLPPLEVIRRGMDNVPSMKALDEYVDSSFLDDHIYPSEASSESSVEFDAAYTEEARCWQAPQIRIKTNDSDAEAANQLSPSCSQTSGLQPPQLPVRHHRSRTMDSDPSYAQLPDIRRRSPGMSGGSYSYAVPQFSRSNTAVQPSEVTVLPGAEQDTNLSFAALALSPRTEASVVGPLQPPADFVLSYQDGLRLNAMLAALSTGGTRTDVLAAAEIPPDAIASPPSPTHQPDLKPCAAVRSEAAMLLKALLGNPAESLDTLRQLITLAEQPTGPEAIAKEGGLHTVVMVMSSDLANYVVVTMCAELLRVLLPGGIAMSRRKLLKRLPQLEAGALSGVGGNGILQGDGPAESEGAAVNLNKKHLKKLRKRSTAIAWACHALVRTMQRFQCVEPVQDKGSSALWGVLSPRNEPQSMAHREIDNYIQRVAATEVLEAGGIFVLINNLKLHAGHANVAYSAVGALLALAQLGPQARRAIEKQQGRRAIRSAMTCHPAIGYGGRFASLASWLESSDDDTALEAEARLSDGGQSSSQMEDDENAPPSEGKPFKQRSKRLRLKRFSRKAPSIPLGAASLPDPQEYDSVRHIRMSEDFEQGTKGAEEKLWGRFIGAISSGWRQNPRQGQD